MHAPDDNLFVEIDQDSGYITWCPNGLRIKFPVVTRIVGVILCVWLSILHKITKCHYNTITILAEILL